MKRGFEVLVVMAAVVAALAGPQAFALCDSAVETYAIFQCAGVNPSYFEPVPAPFTAADLTGVFWEFGFGNNIFNNGTGVDGTGMAGKMFVGNDSGVFPVDILDADSSFPGVGFPAGSVCLGSNDWANSGVDGCCDNPRSSGNADWDGAPGYNNSYNPYGPYPYPSDDNILNPYYATYLSSIGYPGEYSIGSVMDYPTAVLLKTPDMSYFAIAAVASMTRGNDGSGQSGPCSSLFPGANPAPCDFRQGFYDFADITTGNPNLIPSEAGKNNAVPWQAAPQPTIVSQAPAPGGDIVAFEWTPARWYSDASVRPSNNPTLATRNLSKPRDPNAAPGVGVRDLLTKAASNWAGLVRYDIEEAPAVLDPNGNVDYPNLSFSPVSGYTDLPQPFDPNTGDPSGTVQVAGFQTTPFTCYRVRVKLGKKPITTTPSTAACRIGHCGDLGYEVASLAPAAVTCLGAALPAAVTASISSSSASPAEGSQIAACVSFDMSGSGETLGSYGATVSWDPNILQFVSATGGSPPFDTPIINSTNAASGMLSASDAEPAGAGGQVPVLCLEFDVIGVAGSSTPLDLGLTSIFGAGTFTNLLSITTVTDDMVDVVLQCIVGDVNGDTLVNSGDALIILSNEILLPIPPIAATKIAAGCGDADGSGTTDSTDAGVILSLEVGLPIDPNFPIGSSNVTTDSCPCAIPPASAPTPPVVPEAAARITGFITPILAASAPRPHRGDDIEVTVSLDMGETGLSLGSYGLLIQWDPRAADFLSLTRASGSTSFPSPLVNATEAGEGVLRLAQASPQGAGGLVELARLRFRARRALPDPESLVRLSFTSLGSVAPDFRDLRPLVVEESQGRR